MIKPRYGRAALGFLDRLMRSGISPSAALTCARLRFLPAKRTIPGLLNLGEAGLAEALDIEASAFRKQARELEAAGAMIFDRRERLAYMVGSIEDDPPTSKNSVIAFGRQASELPDSSVRTEVFRAVAEVLKGHPEFEAHFADASQVAGQETIQPLRQRVRQDLSQDASQELLRSRYPDPIPLSAAAAAIQRAWARLPQPFAAAAAEDLEKAGREIPPAECDALITALAESKFASGEGGLNVVPTLRSLLAKPEYRARIVRGEFRSATAKWRCTDCEGTHVPTADCPPKCRGCHRHHPPTDYCLRLKRLEDEECALGDAEQGGSSAHSR